MLLCLSLEYTVVLPKEEDILAGLLAGAVQVPSGGGEAH